ncbi:ribosome maturation factor RimM [Legionella jordanis]|uniref:ribosome maturation factor RimM n=1 Tax=Legionella jordanis TaxID=456 RepID=UPI000EFF90E3|nr:ribosome maturation factor RimM [Legionella jordanis]RMX17956.1 ribosome maturation factor RimM [Legionella jordanis]
MDKLADWIVIGRFGRPHGIKGFVTVHSFTEPRDNILQYTDWHAYINKQWQALKIVRVEMTEKSILVRLEGFNEREQAAALGNVEIAVSRDQLPNLEEGEYYWHELVGMQVVNQQGILLGVVKEIMPTGSNDVLVVVGEKRHLIPYLPGQFILDIDSERAVISVDWDVNF